jgi:GNAT superfamily N-acetyltransferase
MNNRKTNRKMLALLPEKLRFKLMRSKVKIEQEWPSTSLEIKIADTEEELESAYRLLHDSYVSSGFMNPDPTGMRVLPQHLLPQTTTIVAKWDGQVIGTLSLIRDNPFGLPLEKIFAVEDRRQNGRRLAEVSSLAVDPKYRGQVSSALFPLFRFVYQYARDCFGIHEFVIAVNPSMVDLYLGFICFERLKSKAKSYDFVKGAPAVGLYLNFETAPDRWKAIFNKMPVTRNFFKYWTEKPSNIRNRMPERSYHSASDPILTPELLQEFFLTKANLSKKLTFLELQVLLEVYPFQDFQAVLKPLYNVFTRKDVRIETHMKAEIGNEKVKAEVLNVSKTGLLLRAQMGAFPMDHEVTVKIWLNENSSTTLKAMIRWSPKNCLFGLKLVETSKEWNDMIEALEFDYNKVATKSSKLKLVA